MFKLIKSVFLTLLFIVGITFSMENTELLVLHYFGYETPPIRLYLLILLSVFFGVLLAGVGFMIDQRSLKKAVRSKNQEIESLERESRTNQERGRAVLNPEENG
ncbi:MAG: LapA family protein [Deltaproteobacteria bacterium]|nr:LapA family protein [Deltaproteobacteria bacterium]